MTRTTKIEIEESREATDISVTSTEPVTFAISIEPKVFTDPRVVQLEKALAERTEELSRERLATLKVRNELGELRNKKKATPKKAAKRR